MGNTENESTSIKHQMAGKFGGKLGLTGNESIDEINLKETTTDLSSAFLLAHTQLHIMLSDADKNPYLSKDGTILDITQIAKIRDKHKAPLITAKTNLDNLLAKVEDKVKSWKKEDGSIKKGKDTAKHEGFKVDVAGLRKIVDGEVADKVNEIEALDKKAQSGPRVLADVYGAFSITLSDKLDSVPKKLKLVEKLFAKGDGSTADLQLGVAFEYLSQCYENLTSDDWLIQLIKSECDKYGYDKSKWKVFYDRVHKTGIIKKLKIRYDSIKEEYKKMDAKLKSFVDGLGKYCSESEHERVPFDTKSTSEEYKASFVKCMQIYFKALENSKTAYDAVAKKNDECEKYVVKVEGVNSGTLDGVLKSIEDFYDFILKKKLDAQKYVQENLREKDCEVFKAVKNLDDLYADNKSDRNKYLRPIINRAYFYNKESRIVHMSSTQKLQKYLEMLTNNESIEGIKESEIQRLVEKVIISYAA